MKNSMKKCVATFIPSMSDVVEVRSFYSDGREEKKNLRFADFRRILAVKETQHNFQSVNMKVLPELPKGYFKGAVSEESDCSFAVLIVIPAGRRNLRYYGQNMEIPFPSLIFSSTVVNGKQVESRMFALKDDKPNKDSKLYHYPFGNVYEDGKICWGNNVVNGLNKMSDIDIVTMAFFNSETNDDLFRAPNGVSTQRELIKKIENLKCFPNELLKGIQGKSVETLLGAFLE